MNQKAKGPAVRQHLPSRIETSPDMKEFNMDTINTQNAGGATELPVQRVTRLAYELSDALDEYADGTMMAAITPRNCSTGCPVLFGPISTHRSMVTLQANNTQPSYDPLLEAIDAYLAGLDDFNKNAPELDWEAYADRSFEPPLKVLSKWTQPAWTRQGALKALQIAMDDAHGVYGSEAAERMVKAAMGYLAGIQNYGAVICE